MILLLSYFLSCAVCEPVSLKNMAPVSSPVKPSFAERAESPENICVDGKS